MRGLARQLLAFEILICFLPNSLLLLVGMVLLPMQVRFRLQNSLYWEGSVLTIAMVACGIAGLCSLVSVVSALFAGRERIESPVPVLGGVVLGAAPLLCQFVLVLAEGVSWDGLWFVLIVMPLVATAHILYLSRGMFIAGFSSGSRPLVGPGSWTALGVIVCIAAIVLVLSQGSSYGELSERRAYWVLHRPAAYSYDWSCSGWLEPDRSLPRRVHVVGSELTAASYTFKRGPGDTRQYPAPIEAAWTIDDIFNALIDEKKRGARISAEFDDATGAVLRARVESDRSDADWSVEIQRFEPLDPNEARKPMPMFLETKKRNKAVRGASD
jgi:hypothetical protein